MDTVARIIATSTKKRDLLLTFAIDDEHLPGNIRCLILLRSAAQEWVFEEHERGIAVSMEGEDGDANDLKSNLLIEFAFDAQTKRATLKTRTHTCDLDLGRTRPEEIAQMQAYLTKMNFDGKTKVVGL